ncbi:MAG: L-sorbose 1-phosphate reductase [Spirochaetes bacterium]|nr:MAG: L-sorbose 1-phosphate reductase [Spirochaetota bacterium]
MRTKAVRMYGKKDLRLEEFELRKINDNEILAQVISDTICMSTYKAVIQGRDHKRVPNDINVNPIIIGHEFAGIIIEVGQKLKNKYNIGERFALQPNINYKGLGFAPGYSFTDFGGDAAHIIIPNYVIENGFLLKYNGDAFFKASLAEPLSCIISALRASYHVDKQNGKHLMGIKDRGRMIIIGGCGPMGLGTIDLIINWEKKPKLLVVTDINEDRLRNAKRFIPPSQAKERGVELIYCNTKNIKNVVQHLLDISSDHGYDDIMIMAPVVEVVEQADKITSEDACINFFSGPTDKSFSARINLYDVHYKGKHIIGTSGGNTEDMKIALKLIEDNLIHPEVMITHIGGLNAVINTTLNLPHLPGGKKLIYTNINLDLIPLNELLSIGSKNPLFQNLYKIIKPNKFLWSAEAENYLLKNTEKI